MTDTTIRVSTEARKRLKAYAAVHDLTHDEALKQLLEQADGPDVISDAYVLNLWRESRPQDIPE